MEKLLRFLLYRGTTLLISRECTKVKLMIAISLEKLSGCLGLNKKFKKGKLNKLLNNRLLGGDGVDYLLAEAGRLIFVEELRECSCIDVLVEVLHDLWDKRWNHLLHEGGEDVLELGRLCDEHLL